MKLLELEHPRTKVAWQQVRVLFLIVAFCGLALALAKSAIDPPAHSPAVFTFPTVVPLPKWRPLPSSPLSSDSQLQEQPSIKGRHYRYTQNGSSLDIEMRYLVNTDGDIETLIQKYTAIPLTSLKLSSSLRRQQGVGFYLLFTDQQQAYLSACINPYGESTVTRNQFLRNRNTSDLQPHRLLIWLLGQADLRDWRCLWAHLSVPLNNLAPENSYSTLEATWVVWQQRWRSLFPN